MSLLFLNMLSILHYKSNYLRYEMSKMSLYFFDTLYVDSLLSHNPRRWAQMLFFPLYFYFYFYFFYFF